MANVAPRRKVRTRSDAGMRARDFGRPAGHRLGLRMAAARRRRRPVLGPARSSSGERTAASGSDRARGVSGGGEDQCAPCIRREGRMFGCGLRLRQSGPVQIDGLANQKKQREMGEF